MNPLEIEVLWHTDETRKLSEAGMEWDIDDCTWKTMTFYHIAAIQPYDFDEKHKDMCKIYSNDDEKTVKFYFLMLGNYELLQLGFSAGLESVWRQVGGPLKEIAEIMGSKNKD